jgi:hypothetical protein
MSALLISRNRLSALGCPSSANSGHWAACQEDHSDVFDSDQFCLASIAVPNYWVTALCEEEGYSSFLKNLGRLVRPYFLRIVPRESDYDPT